VKPLLAFRGLTHDSQGVLTAVYGFAPVKVKLHCNVRLGSIRKAGLELSVASFAYPDGRERRGLLYDPQFAFLHDCSLAHLAGRA